MLHSKGRAVRRTCGRCAFAPLTWVMLLGLVSCHPAASRQSVVAPVKAPWSRVPSHSAIAPLASASLSPPVPRATPAAPAPAAETAELGPPVVPNPLAPLGPYPPFTPAVPAGAPATTVLAATAPAKQKARTDWFWPWVVQALLAHDHVFQLVSDLHDISASMRAVQLVEVEDPGKPNLSLFVHCLNGETCEDVVRVLKAVVPNSPARISGELPGSTPTGRTARTEKEQLLPLNERGTSAVDPASACARLSVCARHEDEQADARLGLKCQGAPASFPIACAAQLTCYDVAECAKLKTSSGPVFSPFSNLMSQIASRGARIGGGLAVADDGGGGGLDPTQISASFEGLTDPRRGSWAALLLSFDVADQDPVEHYYKSGDGAWAVAFIEPNGVALLGPEQLAVGTTYNAVNVPSSVRLRPDSFDFDGDGSPELFLPVSSFEHANSGTRSYQIWTLRAGAVTRYRDTEALPIVDSIDADGDGRPDLVLDYDGTLNDEGTHSSMSSQNWKLAHSLRDGSFSTKDSVAQHYAVSP